MLKRALYELVEEIEDAEAFNQVERVIPLAPFESCFQSNSYSACSVCAAPKLREEVFANQRVYLGPIRPTSGKS